MGIAAGKGDKRRPENQAALLTNWPFSPPKREWNKEETGPAGIPEQVPETEENPRA